MKEKTHLMKVLRAFSEQENIQQRLDFFHCFENKNLKRWENWLQMELLFFLQCKGFDDIWPEDRLSRDQRRKQVLGVGAYQASIDIAYRRKQSLSDSYIALELKIANRPSDGIRNSVKDLGKLASLLKSRWYYSCVFSVSIFKDYEIPLGLTKFIRNTGETISFGPYKAAIFGWECSDPMNLTPREYHSEYMAWYDSLKQGYPEIFS